jgi:hypothetical protein
MLSQQRTASFQGVEPVTSVGFKIAVEMPQAMPVQ